VIVLLTTVVGPIIIVGIAVLASTERLAYVWWPIIVVMVVSSVLATLLVLHLGERLVRPLARLSGALASEPSASFPDNAYLQPADDDPEEVEQVKVALLRLIRRLDSEARSRATVAAAITHDLRTPLVAILRAVDAYDRVSRDESQTTLLLTNVRSAADEARALATQLLDVQRYGSGLDDIRFTAVDLGALAVQCAERVRDEASLRSVELTLEGVGMAVGDPHAVGRAVANLVENAVRHARSRVHVRVFDGMVRVEDDGAGLPADLATLIEPFVGGGATHAGGVRVPQGMAGLGLFIVERIARAHGGKLIVENSGEHGTALLLYLSGAR
jgi:signal transduction histidine kinase